MIFFISTTMTQNHDCITTSGSGTRYISKNIVCSHACLTPPPVVHVVYVVYVVYNSRADLGGGEQGVGSPPPLFQIGSPPPFFWRNNSHEIEFHH